MEKIGKDWKLFLKFGEKGINDSVILPWLLFRYKILGKNIELEFRVTKS